MDVQSCETPCKKSTHFSLVTKLPEGNVFTGVCLSFCSGVPCDLTGSPSVQGLAPPPVYRTRSTSLQGPAPISLLVKSGAQYRRPIQICSLEDPLVLTSGGYWKAPMVCALYWNAFLFVNSFIMEGYENFFKTSVRIFCPKHDLKYKFMYFS